MSKLFMKQKVFSWKDRFTVKDEYDQDRYYVEGEFFTLGKKLHVYDTAGEEKAFIQEKVFSLKPRYFVFVGGVQAAEIVREFKLIHPLYFVNGLDWKCTGNFSGHQYEISRDGEDIARVSKAWFSWGDSYELEVADDRNELLSLAVVLSIDCVQAMLEAASASSSSASSN